MCRETRRAGSTKGSAGEGMQAMARTDVSELRRLAARIRLSATRMVAIQGFGYLGQALSSAEIFAVLFGGGVLRVGRDRFVLSPGHYVIGLYAIAAELGLIDPNELARYGQDGALLEAIGTERTPFVDLVCGSLGQGLSGAIGFALAARLAGEDRRTFVFVSDGELEEGQTWEAAMFAAHHRLDRLTVLLDANNSQVDGPVTSVTTLEPLTAKWRAFGWHVAEVDGHDVAALSRALAARAGNGKPRIVIARTDILGHMRAIPATADGHFLKLDPALRQAIESEIEAELA
jgi:transketolase